MCKTQTILLRPRMNERLPIVVKMILHMAFVTSTSFHCIASGFLDIYMFMVYDKIPCTDCRNDKFVFDSLCII